MSQQARDAVKRCQELTDLRLRMCLYAIADRSRDSEGPFYSWPGSEDIAQYCARAVSTIEPWIRKLVEQKYLLRRRRNGGMGYFILLSTEGKKIDQASITISMDGEHAYSHEHANGTLPLKPPTLPLKNDPLKGTNNTENNTENREEALTYPQQSERRADPDGDSAAIWDRLVWRIRERQLVKPHVMSSLRNARLELYRESGQALVITPRTGSWFRGQFAAVICEYLPAVTQLGWLVTILDESELRETERTEQESVADAHEYPESDDAELLPAQGSDGSRMGAVSRRSSL